MKVTLPIFLFDLDGTLINFSPEYSRRYAEIIRKTFAQFSIVPDESLIKRIELFGDFEAIINLIGDKQADYFWFKVEQADFQLRKDLIQMGKIKLVLDAPAVLESLQKILSPEMPLGLVSNTNPASAFWQMWHFNLLPYFQRIYLLNWNFTTPKPDPGGFLACVAEYGPVGSHPVVYIGDSLSDVQMVQRAKIIHPELETRVILFNGRTSMSKETQQADQIITNLSELLHLARQMISATRCL